MLTYLRMFVQIHGIRLRVVHWVDPRHECRAWMPHRVAPFGEPPYHPRDDVVRVADPGASVHPPYGWSASERRWDAALARMGRGTKSSWYLNVWNMEDHPRV